MVFAISAAGAKIQPIRIVQGKYRMAGWIDPLQQDPKKVFVGSEGII